MEIIAAAERHIPAIIELWKEFMDFHKDFDSRFPMRKNAHLSFDNHLRELMTSENNVVYVALDRNRVVGFATCTVNRYAPIWERDKYGSIDSLAVESSYRGRGIGEQMLTKIYEWFDTQGIDRIEVALAVKNKVAQSFWRKHGFRENILHLYLDRHVN